MKAIEKCISFTKTMAPDTDMEVVSEKATIELERLLRVESLAKFIAINRSKFVEHDPDGVKMDALDALAAALRQRE